MLYLYFLLFGDDKISEGEWDEYIESVK